MDQISCDWRGLFPIVANQGRLGSCTAIIASSLVSFLLEDAGLFSFIPSRLYIYWNTRVLVSNQSYDRDAGATMEQTCKSLKIWGICPEEIWEYDILRFWKQPKDEAYDFARWYKKNMCEFDYAPVQQDENILCDLVSQKQMVMCSISMFESFQKEVVAISGDVPLPNTLEEIFIEEHSLLLVGFDKNARVFFAMNSWGDSWGLQGFCKIQFSYILNSNLTRDFFTLSLSKICDDTINE